jgi:hypothetical protein
MAMAAIQADRESAAARARNICVLVRLSPIPASGMARLPKLINSQTSSGLISGID